MKCFQTECVANLILHLVPCFLVLRFGPLVWRSSKERKKGKKAARNAKCNSGDSGIQIEVQFTFIITMSISVKQTNYITTNQLVYLWF
jgi:hypothetical protein